ncbi:hypothetical protein OJAV_G00036800 [Oryzias javanicus]|uniref:Uncharacterized protein n=1 Tax=Oryzias javanicus TaxID=123683 RepID=A0A3S2PRF9_ORYJA|nr:hypothetical protein OJAV_G00036800 [Oryzias javanicus]
MYTGIPGAGRDNPRGSITAAGLGSTQKENRTGIQNNRQLHSKHNANLTHIFRARQAFPHLKRMNGLPR